MISKDLSIGLKKKTDHLKTLKLVEEDRKLKFEHLLFKSTLKMPNGIRIVWVWGHQNTLTNDFIKRAKRKQDNVNKVKI